jgi:hypothetical protein
MSLRLLEPGNLPLEISDLGFLGRVERGIRHDRIGIQFIDRSPEGLAEHQQLAHVWVSRMSMVVAHSRATVSPSPDREGVG